MGVGSQVLPNGPVEESEAILPAAVAGGTAAKAAAGAAGGGAAVGWALREFEVFGSDDPAEGLTAEALQSSNYDTIAARQSTNASTIIDNKNILDGIQHAAHAEGKIDAIDALNNQESESDALEDAKGAIKGHYTTVLKNFYETWNETLFELNNILNAQDEHEDLGIFDGFNILFDQSGWEDREVEPLLYEDEIELPDGSTFELHSLNMRWEQGSGSRSEYFTPLEITRDDIGMALSYTIEGDENETTTEPYLTEDWIDINDKITTYLQEDLDGITKWVSSIYDEVQSGELDTGELLTPREQAELTAEDEDFPQAIADLQALNVGVDLEREAEIYLDDIQATLYGQLAYSGEKTLEVGEIDPDATDEDDEPLYPGTIYFTYDVSQGQGEWSAYDEGIDGGTLTFTSEPFEGTIYTVDTTDGETAEFVTDDLTEDDDGDEWTIDLSDQLENQITEVDQIEYYAETEETQYETIQLQEPFEIVRFTDSDGEEYDSAEFERSEPHDDDNYISEEEWKEQQERHEKLIEKYEDTQGGGGIGFLDGEEIPAEGVVLIVLAVFAALFGR